MLQYDPFWSLILVLSINPHYKRTNRTGSNNASSLSLWRRMRNVTVTKHCSFVIYCFKCSSSLQSGGFWLAVIAFIVCHIPSSHTIRMKKLHSFCYSYHPWCEQALISFKSKGGSLCLDSFKLCVGVRLVWYLACWLSLQTNYVQNQICFNNVLQ